MSEYILDVSSKPKPDFMRSFLFVLCLSFCFTGLAQKTFIHCGRLINTRTGTMQTEMTVVVEKNKILDVIKGYTAGGATDRMVDLKQYTVMPGLMDCHVHLESQTSPTQYTD